MGYDESISSIVEKHGWQIFHLHLEGVLTKVVREFYAHLTPLNNAFIYVRGVSVLFDEYTINARCGLHDGQDDHSQFAIIITVGGLNQVLKDICVEGTKWIMSKQDCYTIERVSLNPHCRVWKEINVAKIIFKEVHRCAEKNAGSIDFPSLIISLCQYVKVLVQENEDMIPNKGGHYKSYVRKREVATKKSLPKIFIWPMSTFSSFPKELLSNAEEKKDNKVEVDETKLTPTHPTIEENATGR
ncbi:hypothetical protein J1N35_014089 [Gossypium stocksii]|uniref:Putative plant transposon protein domain-containing protein n=1 Tax=Gossypium stocksii TaxID=47602 RepID=A0A9D3VUX7_9ROSI|nr:hypothetical protein J1N35_014089 [Gossypium stocksii]